MPTVVNVQDLEREGLWLLAALLQPDWAQPSRQAVDLWSDRAVSVLVESDRVAESLKLELAQLEPISGQSDWTVTAVKRAGDLACYLAETDHHEVRFSARRAFISYVSEDRPQVERLARDLRLLGVDPWLDRSDLAEHAGLDWARAIQREIEDGLCFVPCFSTAWNQRVDTYADEEVRAALRHDRIDSSDEHRWFVPVEFDRGSARPVARRFKRDLTRVQSIPLYDDWDVAMVQLADAVSPPGPVVRQIRGRLKAHDRTARIDAIVQARSHGDIRLLIPVITACSAEFRFLDAGEKPNDQAVSGKSTTVLYEALRSLRDLARHSDEAVERIVPVLRELWDRRIYRYKVEEALTSIQSPVARRELDAFKNTEAP